jgi:outer membrane protein, adhesin transport system
LKKILVVFLLTYFAFANELENSLQKKIEIQENNQKFELLIKEALNTHPSIASMAEAIKVANSSVESAKWGFFPTPSIDISQKGSTTQTTARLDQPLWTGGKLTSAYDIALSRKNEMQVSLEESKYILIDNLINILQTYLLAKAQIEALSNGKKDLLNFVSMLERRIDAGASSESDMSLLKSRISQIDSDLVTVKSKLELSKSQFEILSSLKVSNVITNVNERINNSINIEEAISKLKIFSPQIKNIEAQVKTAQYEVDSAKSRYMPTVFLRAEHTKGSIYDSSDKDEHNLIYLSMTANTGAGLSLLSEVEGSRAKVIQLKFQKLNKEKEVIELLVTEHNSMLAAYHKSAAMQITIKSSMEVLNSYSRLFIAGKKQWLDLVNASKELMINNQELASQQALVKIMKYKLALRIGEIDLENGDIKHDL